MRRFGGLQASELLGQLRFVCLHSSNLAGQYFRPSRVVCLLSSNVGAAFVHFGDPAFGFACTFLPTANFGHRHGAALAALRYALFERRKVRLIACQQVARCIMCRREVLDAVGMMRPVGQGMSCRLGRCALRLRLGHILRGGGHPVAKRRLCRF